MRHGRLIITPDGTVKEEDLLISLEDEIHEGRKRLELRPSWKNTKEPEEISRKVGRVIEG